mmetsp:Transcript_22113/g.39699  ORF Transcript_22113/g.39699 Transcript_22113/m.39699 type:complete len:174 (-) Transcript_22113:193-714(-)|eukprot:CAMPEP_0197620590 /NCGR_PEP_ID=MMETSP1338-20131121/1399_1 /TAXON_ID=43686 ORGANISM="Pelagodinium beii, Strain RCC1491" /NCGR_SAMPLE_ID=MMETSP1338 /ASSEMBLY_ACC=CAM_ASM_000754 /LENGTH=173 /DNA_ID=CAMNT_0043189829 /DNA_START=56 /DNA_END=577 /DNA_ORIENTATION=-
MKSAILVLALGMGVSFGTSQPESCQSGESHCADDVAIQRGLDEEEPALELLQRGKSATDSEQPQASKCNHACTRSNWHYGQCSGDDCHCYGGKSKGPYHIKGTGQDLCGKKHVFSPISGDVACSHACARSNWIHGKCEGWDAHYKDKKCMCYGGKGPGPYHLNGIGKDHICGF